MRANVLKPRIRGVRALKPSLANNDCCWVCGGWTQFRFVYSGDKLEDPVFLHLELDGFQRPLQMTRLHGDWVAFQMVPAHKHTRYFFSSPHCPEPDFDDDQIVVARDPEAAATVLVDYGNYPVRLTVPPLLNQTHLAQPRPVFAPDDEHYRVQVHARPRVKNDYQHRYEEELLEEIVQEEK